MNEIIVRIDRYFKYPNIMQQTPLGLGRWGNIKFTEEKINECDYLVILDKPCGDIKTKVNPKNIIHICMEPPNEMSVYRQYGNKQNNYNFSSIDVDRNSLLSHGALPWHLNKSYDYLKNLNRHDLEKLNKIVWITSNQKETKGHFQRMQFLERISKLEKEIDLFGRGINPIHDKWDVLSQYKYGIAYENFRSPYYWTEKIIDCLLCYTLPIYIGSNNISNFFPQGSYISIDPNSKDVEDELKKILTSDLFERSIDTVKLARNLVLERYQLFPFLHSFIQFIESTQGIHNKDTKEEVYIRGGELYHNNYPVKVYIERGFLKLKNYIIKKLVK